MMYYTHYRAHTEPIFNPSNDDISKLNLLTYIINYLAIHCLKTLRFLYQKHFQPCTVIKWPLE